MKILKSKWYVIYSPYGSWDREGIKEFESYKEAVFYVQQTMGTDKRPKRTCEGWYDLISHNENGTCSQEFGIVRGDTMKVNGYL